MDGSTLSGDEFLRRLFDYVARNEAAHLDGTLKLTLTPSSIALLNKKQAELDVELTENRPLDARMQNFERLLSLLHIQAQLKLMPATVDNSQCIVMNLRHLMPNLKRLEIIDCKQHSIRGLSVLRPHLESLILQRSFGELTDVFDACLDDEADQAPWPVLSEVKVDFNGLYALDSSLGNLPAMTTFSCANNNISLLQHLEECTSLRSVNLGYNLVRFILPDAHMTFGNINVLILRNNRLCSITGVRKLFSLEVLDLSHNLLCELAELAPLSYLPCIRNLWLNGNPVALSDNFRANVFGIMSHRLGGPVGEFALEDVRPTPKEVQAAMDLSKTPFLEELRAHHLRWGEKPTEEDLMSRKPRSRAGSIVSMSKRSYANLDSMSYISSMEESQVKPMKPKKKKKARQCIVRVEELNAPRSLANSNTPHDDGSEYLAFLNKLHQERGVNWLSMYTKHLAQTHHTHVAKMKSLVAAAQARPSLQTSSTSTTTTSSSSSTSTTSTTSSSSSSTSTAASVTSSAASTSATSTASTASPSQAVSPSVPVVVEDPEIDDMLAESDFIAARLVPPNHQEPCILTFRPGRYFKECDLDGKPLVTESSSRLSHLSVLPQDKATLVTLFLAEGEGSLEYCLDDEYIDELVATLREDFTEQRQPGWYHHPSPATCSVFVYAPSAEQLEEKLRSGTLRRARADSASLLQPMDLDKSPPSSRRSSLDLRETLDEFEINGSIDTRNVASKPFASGSSSTSGNSSSRTSPTQSSRTLQRKLTTETILMAPPRFLANYDPNAPRALPQAQAQEDQKSTGAANNDIWRNRFIRTTTARPGQLVPKIVPVARADPITEFYFLLLTGQPSTKQMFHFPISVKVSAPFASVFKRPAGTELLLWLLIHPDRKSVV